MTCKAHYAKIIVSAVLGIAALGWVVMTLWNWLSPSLFTDGREIGYAQAMGVLVLSKILFGGFHHHPGAGCWHHRHWEQMTEDELQSGMHSCCGSRKHDKSNT